MSLNNIINIISFLYLVQISLLLNNKEINITNILSYNYIFLHNPSNELSQKIYNCFKEISINNSIILNLLELSNSEKIISDLKRELNKNSSINLNINFPLLIKKDDNKLEIYNNNPSNKSLIKFINEKTKKKAQAQIYSLINYDFLSKIIFDKKNCLILFYIKNSNSRRYIKNIVNKAKKKLKYDINIAYSDIIDKFSFKLFNILDGNESELPCLRFITFKNNVLLFTKKNKINIFDINLIDNFISFVNDSINNKLFFHKYYDESVFKINNHFEKNNICKIKKNKIKLYYNDWCQYCQDSLKIIEDIIINNSYIFKFFELKKYKISNENNIYNNNNDFYLDFLPRLQINDVFNKKSYIYNDEYQKDKIFKYLKNIIKFSKFLNLK